MNLPTFPSFTDGDSDLAKLQQLSQAIGFVTCASSPVGSFPLWHFFKTSTQTGVAAATWTQVSMGTVAIDTDSVLSSNMAKIKTRGIYALEGCVPVQTSASAMFCAARFLITGGGSNPNLASAATRAIGLKASTSDSNTGEDECNAPSAITPFPLYPNDTVQLQVYIDAGGTVDSTASPTATSQRLVCNFTGRWLRYA